MRQALRAAPAPDGHTLLYTASQMAVSKALGAQMRFDPLRDLKPITMTIAIPLVLAVHPSLPVRNIKELVALDRKQPGVLSYSSSGTGASGHLTMALLNVKTGMQALHVPYRGAGPSLTSVLSGETQLSFLVPPIVLPHAASGKLRVIAVSSRERSNVFPNAPTVQEQGVRDYGCSRACTASSAQLAEARRRPPRIPCATRSGRHRVAASCLSSAGLRFNTISLLAV